MSGPEKSGLYSLPSPNKIRLALATGMFLVMAGCKMATLDYMPLKVGSRWSYSVNTTRRLSTPDLAVNRAVAVGDASGFELSGPLGINRLGWSGHRLVASQLAGTGFDPPIPLLDPSLPIEKISWQGTIQGPLSSGLAHASLAHEESTIPVAGVRQPAIKTTLTLNIGSHHVDLLTWWVRGIGIAEQTQRTDGVQDVEISWLSGPTNPGNSHGASKTGSTRL